MERPIRWSTAALVLAVGVLIAGALVFGRMVHAADERVPKTTERAAVPAFAGGRRETPVDSRIELLNAQIAGLNERLSESERLAKADREAQRVPEPDLAANLEQPVPERSWTDGPAVNRRYDQRFEAQVVDSAWAPSEARSLRAFIDVSAPGARVEALECRSSMCRARLGFADRKDRQAFLTSVASPEFAPAAYVSTDAELGKVTLFTARSGQDLPDVSRE